MYGIMKFKKYINEDRNYGIKDEAKHIASILKKDCMPFIKEMKSSSLQNWFYRATEHHYESISKPIKPRKDRRPRNTPKELHDYMDLRFKKKFGWKSRSEGVFVSSDKTILEYTYGDPYLFFPIGSYKYVYHPEIGDIYERLDNKYSISYETYTMTPELMEEIEKEFDRIWSKYTDKNLKKAYINGVEVAFKCKSYYLVNEKYDYFHLKDYIY